MKNPSILVLCTGNSCRSHLAEGILRAVAGDLLDVHSAGSKPAGYVHPLGIRVMREIDIDISGHRSKHMNDFLGQEIETVITVCGNADQACPVFPGQSNRHHWGFDDPAHAVGTEEEQLAVFRRVRDEIRRVFTAYADGRRDQLKATPLPTPSPAMKSVRVYDPAMCCPTGLCGTDIDPELVNFAALLARLGRNGVKVERYNLGQQPMAFVQNPSVKALLDTEGTEVLPLVFVDGQMRFKGRYPTAPEREALDRSTPAGKIPVSA